MRQRTHACTHLLLLLLQCRARQRKAQQAALRLVLCMARVQRVEL